MGDVAVGGGYCAGDACPGFRCAVLVHSSSQTFPYQNSRNFRVGPRFGARLGVGARNVFLGAVTAVAWPLPEIPREEIPQCQAVNSSAHGSLPAGERLLLRAVERS